MRVFKAKLLPITTNPRKNSSHVRIVTILSAVRNSMGIICDKTIEYPETPPETNSKGKIKTAVPKERTKVPATTRAKFFKICFHSLFVYFKITSTAYMLSVQARIVDP